MPISPAPVGQPTELRGRVGRLTDDKCPGISSINGLGTIVLVRLVAVLGTFMFSNK